MRLLSSERPTMRAALLEHFEDRKRPAKQRLEAIAGFHHHELPGQRALGNLGSGEAEHVVIGRQMDVRDDFGDDVQRHVESISRAWVRVSCDLSQCSTSGCSPIRSWRARSWARTSLLLVLQLNPMVRLNSMAVARLMLTWAAFYGVHAAAFFYGLIVLRQLLAVEVRPPGWISLRLLAAFGTIAVSMSAHRHMAQP